MDMDLEARPIASGALEEEGFLEPQAQARDGGEGDLVGERGGGRQEARELCHTQDGGQPVGDLRANERESGPVALEDMWIEEAEAAGAEAHGRGRQAIDIVAVEAVVLQLRFRHAVGRWVEKPGEQVNFADIGCLRPFALATAVERCEHGLTAWGHEISPCVRRVVGVRRKTS
jgi:hypothetical protein